MGAIVIIETQRPPHSRNHGYGCPIVPTSTTDVMSSSSVLEISAHKTQLADPLIIVIRLFYACAGSITFQAIAYT
jgi:hypothetical protein